MNRPQVTPSLGYILPIQLFVYGTLKRGFHNHRFCAQARDIQPAWTWGRLYHLRAGYPALDVPDERILALGTDDPVRDARRAAKMTPDPTPPEGDWDQVQGELVTLADADRDLPPIDRLEGFNPVRACYANLYLRVLVPVWTTDGKVVPAWTYDGRRISARLARCISRP